MLSDIELLENYYNRFFIDELIVLYSKENDIIEKKLLNSIILERIPLMLQDKLVTFTSKYHQDLTEEMFSLIEENVLRKCSPRNLVIYALNGFYLSLNNIEKAIIESNDYSCMYSFATSVKGANKDELFKCILNGNNPEFIYRLTNLPGINAELVIDKLIELKAYDYLLNVARSAKNVSLDKIELFIIESKNIDLIMNYIKHVKKINIHLFEDALINMKKAKYLYALALENKDCDYKKIEQAIIKIGEPHYMYLCASSFANANIVDLENGIISCGDPQYIFLFAFYNKKASICKLEDAIINTNDPEYIYKFAKSIQGANVERLANVLIKIGNYEYITKIRELIYDKKMDNLINNKIDYKNGLSSLIMDKEITNEDIISYLYNNIDVPESKLALKVYYEALLVGKETIEQLYLLDEEYFSALKSLSKDNKKRKINVK